MVAADAPETLAYTGGDETAGVILIRFPAWVRSALGQAVVDVVSELGERLAGAFVVLRARPRPRVATDAP